MPSMVCVIHGTMAMFLSESGAASRVKGELAQAKLDAVTSFGPPAHPAPVLTVGAGGVSFLPSVPNATVTGPQGAKPSGLKRINTRSMSKFEANPRVGVAYSVDSDKTKGMPAEGDLVFFRESVGSWKFPQMQSLQSVAEELAVTSRAESWSSVEDLTSAVPSALTPVGVFHSTVDHESQNPRKMFRTDTITLNISRHASINDYWGQQLRAGSRIWICFVLVNAPAPTGTTPAGAPAPKKASPEEGVVTLAIGANTLDEVEDQILGEFPNPPVAAVCFRIGKCQNYLLSRVHANGPSRVMERTAYSTKTERLREVQLDPLLSIPYVLDKF